MACGRVKCTFAFTHKFAAHLDVKALGTGMEGES
jgi:hypothetical protein